MERRNPAFAGYRLGAKTRVGTHQLHLCGDQDVNYIGATTGTSARRRLQPERIVKPRRWQLLWQEARTLLARDLATMVAQMGAFIIVAAAIAACLFLQLSLIVAIALGAGLLAVAVLIPGGLRFVAAVLVLIIVGYVLALNFPPARIAPDADAKPRTSALPSATPRRLRPPTGCHRGECRPTARRGGYREHWHRDDWYWDDCPPFRIPPPPRRFDRI